MPKRFEEQEIMLGRKVLRNSPATLGGPYRRERRLEGAFSYELPLHLSPEDVIDEAQGAGTPQPLRHEPPRRKDDDFTPTLRKRMLASKGRRG